ncbi:DnaJ (Hsp40), sub C, member 2 [Nowakowskiella sp. JEL0078]|nr:DnaJ (Hsp40), sub C, member 2 [Nowakowskiella sp. JEL0078]
MTKLLADEARRAAEEKLKQEKVKSPWSPKEVAILIKAFKTYPGGTTDRWETIADYVNLHGGEDNETEASRAKRMRTADECIKMSKSVQSGAAGVADRSKLQNATFKRPVQPTPPPEEISRPESSMSDAPDVSATSNGHTDSNQTINGTTNGTVKSSEWTTSQQLALEAALKQYPASQFTAAPTERWVKIAELIEGKSKKDVKARVKELAEMIKKKKGGK